MWLPCRPNVNVLLCCHVSVPKDCYFIFIIPLQQKSISPITADTTAEIAASWNKGVASLRELTSQKK